MPPFTTEFAFAAEEGGSPQRRRRSLHSTTTMMAVAFSVVLAPVGTCRRTMSTTTAKGVEGTDNVPSPMTKDDEDDFFNGEDERVAAGAAGGRRRLADDDDDDAAQPRVPRGDDEAATREAPDLLAGGGGPQGMKGPTRMEGQKQSTPVPVTEGNAVTHSATPPPHSPPLPPRTGRTDNKGGEVDDDEVSDGLRDVTRKLAMMSNPELLSHIKRYLNTTRQIRRLRDPNHEHAMFSLLLTPDRMSQMDGDALLDILDFPWPMPPATAPDGTVIASELLPQRTPEEERRRVVPPAVGTDSTTISLLSLYEWQNAVFAAVRDRLMEQAQDLTPAVIARALIVLGIFGGRLDKIRKDVGFFRQFGKLLAHHINDIRDPHTLCYVLIAMHMSRVRPPNEFFALIGRRLPVLAKKTPLDIRVSMRTFAFFHRVRYPELNPYRFLADRVMMAMKAALLAEGKGADFVDAKKLPKVNRSGRLFDDGAAEEGGGDEGEEGVHVPDEAAGDDASSGVTTSTTGKSTVSTGRRVPQADKALEDDVADLTATDMAILERLRSGAEPESVAAGGVGMQEEATRPQGTAWAAGTTTLSSLDGAASIAESGEAAKKKEGDAGAATEAASVAAAARGGDDSRDGTFQCPDTGLGYTQAVTEKVFPSRRRQRPSLIDASGAMPPTSASVPTPAAFLVRQRFARVAKMNPPQLTRFLHVMAMMGAPWQQYLRPISKDLLVPSLRYFNPPSFSRLIGSMKRFKSEDLPSLQAVLEHFIRIAVGGEDSLATRTSAASSSSLSAARTASDGLARTTTTSPPTTLEFAFHAKVVFTDVLDVLHIFALEHTPINRLPSPLLSRFYQLCLTMFTADGCAKLRSRDMLDLVAVLHRVDQKQRMELNFAATAAELNLAAADGRAEQSVDGALKEAAAPAAAATSDPLPPPPSAESCSTATTTLTAASSHPAAAAVSSLLDVAVDLFATRMAYLLELGVLPLHHAEAFIDLSRQIHLSRQGHHHSNTTTTTTPSAGPLSEAVAALRTARLRVNEEGDEEYLSQLDIDVREVFHRTQYVNNINTWLAYRPLPPGALTEYKAAMKFMRADDIIEGVHLHEQSYPGALHVSLRRALGLAILEKLALELRVMKGELKGRDIPAASKRPPAKFWLPAASRLQFVERCLIAQEQQLGGGSPRRFDDDDEGAGGGVIAAAARRGVLSMQEYEDYNPNAPLGYTPILLTAATLTKLTNMLVATPLERVRNSLITWEFIRAKAHAMLLAAQANEAAAANVRFTSGIGGAAVSSSTAALEAVMSRAMSMTASIEAAESEMPPTPRRVGDSFPPAVKKTMNFAQH